MLGVTESLIYGYKAGLDLEEMVNLIKGGAAGSKMLDSWGLKMAERNFKAGFFVEHFVKDMGIALDEANRMNLCLPGLERVK